MTSFRYIYSISLAQAMKLKLLDPAPLNQAICDYRSKLNNSVSATYILF